MFHVEVRMGMQVVREFNVSEQRLWVQFIAPLMADSGFVVEGHDFIPRQTRLKVYEGPELRPDQLGMGRGWQNVERTALDVTPGVLARARQHLAATRTGDGASRTGDEATRTKDGAAREGESATAAQLLRERLIGRLGGGPIAAGEILAAAAELMPDATEHERLAAARQATWALLERDIAQLTPRGRLS